MSSVDEPVYTCWTKATNMEAGPPRYSVSWVLARRGWFDVFPDRVQCGDWVIRPSDVRAAVLYRSKSFLVPVTVLSVATDRGTFQFGFNPWVELHGRLPFEAREERVAMRYSAFSIVARGVVLAYLAYYLARWFAQP